MMETVLLFVWYYFSVSSRYFFASFRKLNVIRPITAAIGNAAIRSALGSLFQFKSIILITVVVLSILFYRPFCKWICPLGAIYSLFNKVSLLSIKVKEDQCIGCHKCTTACKMDVDVLKSPNHPECIRCGACMKACPKDAICFQFMKTQK